MGLLLLHGITEKFLVVWRYPEEHKVYLNRKLTLDRGSHPRDHYQPYRIPHTRGSELPQGSIWIGIFGDKAPVPMANALVRQNSISRTHGVPLSRRDLA